MAELSSPPRVSAAASRVEKIYVKDLSLENPGAPAVVPA